MRQLRQTGLGCFAPNLAADDFQPRSGSPSECWGHTASPLPLELSSRWQLKIGYRLPCSLQDELLWSQLLHVLVWTWDLPLVLSFPGSSSLGQALLLIDTPAGPHSELVVLHPAFSQIRVLHLLVVVVALLLLVVVVALLLREFLQLFAPL